MLDHAAESDAPPPPRLVLNRHAKVRAISSAEETRFELAAPVPGDGLRICKLSEDERQLLDAGLRQTVAGDGRLRDGVSAKTVQALQRVGLLVAEDHAPEDVQFSCSIPSVRSVSSDDLTCAAGVRLFPPGEARLQMPEGLRNAAVDGQWIAWANDPARGLEWPVWLTAEQAAELRDHTDARPSLDAFDAHAREWASRLAACRSELVTHGYTILHEIIPATFIVALQAYFAGLVSNGFLVRGDRQSLRYNSHNEPLSCWLHRHTLPLIARAVPEPIKCSYTYLGFYLSGAVLGRHTDRAQCEYTLSLAIDAQPSARREDAWPLRLDLNDGTSAAILLAPGDGVLYRGTTLPHYRERLAEGRTSWSMFLHYVPETFEGTLD